MRKILNFFNIANHIRRYKASKNLGEYMEGEKSSSGNIALDIFIGIALLIGIFCSFYFAEGGIKFYVLGGFLIIALIAYIIVRVIMFLQRDDRYTKVRLIRLVREENGVERTVRTWYLTEFGYKQLIIVGRSRRDLQVDIDLSGEEYSMLVNYTHAEMKKSGNIWYYTERGTKCSGYLNRYDNKANVEILQNKPYRLGSEDVIYVAGKVKLIVE